nr:hypothetical protein [Tanacetum cinerariifolium]
MITILEKYEHNQDFHQIVDFIEASHIRYALTFNPIVYVSHIRQFWSTARIETMEEGTKILATVDGKLRTVSESSIRRNLKLNDEEGISSLPDAELFENLQLMGYNILPNQKFTFQKGQFSDQWKCLIHTIMVYNFSKMIFDGMVKNGVGSGTQTESYHTCTSEASQSSQHELPSSSLPPVLTESLPTTEMVSKFEAQEVEINKEMATILTSMDVATILTSGGVQVVPTAVEVATATVSIPTGSGMVSTTSPTIPTTALIFTTATESTPYTRRKGKEKMVESGTPKKKKLQEQIDVQMLIDGVDINNETVAKYLQEYDQFAAELPFERRIELISDLVKYQDNYAKVFKYQTQQRKPLTKKQQREFYTSVLRNQARWKDKHFKGMTLEEIKEKFDLVWKQFQDFIPLGSKEEAERFKRKGLRLEQESVKKVTTSEEGRIVGNKMHKAFPLPVIEFPLPEEVPTASEESSHCQKKRDANAEKIALLMKSSSNCQSKSYDNYAKYKNDNQTGQFGNQRTVTVARDKETVGSQQTKEIDEQELEAHYSYMAKIQEVPTADSCTNTEPLEKTD